MNAELRKLVLLLAVFFARSDGHELRPLVSTPLEDTNVYVCPPVSSGRVMYDGHAQSYTKYPGAISYGVYDWRYFSAHGYASFDLGGLPDSIDVLSVRLWYYQYDCGGMGPPTPYTALTLIPDVNAPAQQLFTDIASGPVVDPLQYTANGWVVRSFNSDGLAAVDSCRLRGQSINLGVRGGSCAYGSAYGIGPYHPLRAYLEIRYSTTVSYCDVVADEVLTSFPLVADDSVVVVGRFKNTGNLTAYDFPVYASCNGSVGDTIIVDSLAPDETVSVRAALSPAGQPKSETLMLCSRVQTDWCPYNDTAIKSTYVFPHGTSSAESFEPEYSPAFPPTGWSAYHGGDSTGWHRAGPPARYAHTGDHQASSASGDPPDDWLITYGLAPAASNADTVGLFCRDYLQVWALGSQDPNDPLGLLLDTVYESTNWCEAHLGLDQYDGRAIYIGFRRYNADATGASLDDIWFTSERTSAVEETPGPTVPRLKLDLGSNPIAARLLVVRYQTPEAGPLSVLVTDVLGRTVTRLRLPVAASEGEFRLDTRNWPAGVYIIKAMVGPAMSTSKLVLQRGHP